MNTNVSISLLSSGHVYLIVSLDMLIIKKSVKPKHNFIVLIIRDSFDFLALSVKCQAKKQQFSLFTITSRRERRKIFRNRHLVFPA